MPETAETIEFEGYLSRWKVTGGFLFCIACSLVMFNDNPSGRYRWLYEAWAWPFLWTLRLSGVILSAAYLMLMIKAFLKIPLIAVKNEWVTIEAFRKTKFRIADIHDISPGPHKILYIKVGRRKHGIPPWLEQDPQWLRERLDDLAKVIPERSVQ